MTKRMKVTQVITKLDLGGAQQTVLEIAKQLNAELDLSVVAGSDAGDGGSIEEELRGLVNVEVVPALVRRIAPVQDLRALLQLRSIFVADRPVVVHTHSSKAGILGRIAAWSAGVPVRVHTVHGWSFREGQSVLRRRTYIILERLVASLTSVIVVVSMADQDIGMRHRIGRSSRYRCLPTAIDPRLYEPSSPAPVARRELRRGDDVLVVGWIGRLAWPKDPMTLIRAISVVPAAQLVVVGDGPLREHVLDAVQELGLQDRVTMLGVRDDVQPLLETFDVFVLSTRSEGLPRTVLEAMAARVPVVASKVGGVPEIASDRVSALLVPPGDVEALADALRTIATGAIDVRALTRAASQVVDRHSAAEVMGHLLALYRQLVEEAHADRVEP